MSGLNLYIAEKAQQGAAMGEDLGKMCKDCAFKVGSDANNDVFAVEAAVTCLMGSPKFNCHNDGFTDAGKPCAGYLYAMKYLNSIEND